MFIYFVKLKPRVFDLFYIINISQSTHSNNHRYCCHCNVWFNKSNYICNNFIVPVDAWKNQANGYKFNKSSFSWALHLEYFISTKNLKQWSFDIFIWREIFHYFQKCLDNCWISVSITLIQNERHKIKTIYSLTGKRTHFRLYTWFVISWVLCKQYFWQINNFWLLFWSQFL